MVRFSLGCRIHLKVPLIIAVGEKANTALGWFAVLLTLGLLTLGVARVDALLQRQATGVSGHPELIYLPPTRFLRVVSLGYNHVVADVLWFRTVNYFGRHYRANRFYPWLARMCNAVTDLDPGAQYVYRFGGLILPWEADLVDEGMALLRKGVRNLPESWELKYILGFNYYFFKDDLGSATDLLRAAARLPGAPPGVEKLAVLMYASHAGPNRALDFLAELDSGGLSAEMRAVVRQRILELKLSAAIDQLEAAVREFAAQFGHPPADLDDIVRAGLLPAIPQEPFGGRYVLDSHSGTVHTDSGHTPWRLGRSKMHNAVVERERSRTGR